MKNICNWSCMKSICHLGRSSGVTSLLGGCPLVTAGSHLAPPWHDDCSAAVSPVVTGHCHYQMLSAPGPGLYWAVLVEQAEVRSVTSGGQLRPVTLGTSHALLISLKMKSNNYNHILPQTTTLPSSKQQERDSLSLGVDTGSGNILESLAKHTIQRNLKRKLETEKRQEKLG